MKLATNSEAESVQKGRESNICQVGRQFQRQGGVFNMICDILIKNPEVLCVHVQCAEDCESRPSPSCQDEMRAMTDLPQLHAASSINPKPIVS